MRLHAHCAFLNSASYRDAVARRGETRRHGDIVYAALRGLAAVQRACKRWRAPCCAYIAGVDLKVNHQRNQKSSSGVYHRGVSKPQAWHSVRVQLQGKRKNGGIV